MDDIKDGEFGSVGKGCMMVERLFYRRKRVVR